MRFNWRTRLAGRTRGACSNAPSPFLGPRGEIDDTSDFYSPGRSGGKLLPMRPRERSHHSLGILTRGLLRGRSSRWGLSGAYSRPEYIDAGDSHPEFAVRWARSMALFECAWGHDSPRAEPDVAACAALIAVSRDPKGGRLAESAVLDLSLVYGQGLATPEVEECLNWHAENGTPDARESVFRAFDGWEE